jgi:hypothetical protein
MEEVAERGPGGGGGWSHPSWPGPPVPHTASPAHRQRRSVQVMSQEQTPSRGHTGSASAANFLQGTVLGFEMGPPCPTGPSASVQPRIRKQACGRARELAPARGGGGSP